MPAPTAPKGASRGAAQERARALREAQAKRDRRTRLVIIGVLVALVALIAVTVAVIVGQAGRSGLNAVAAPAGADESGGIVVGRDGVGQPTPDAPTVAVYSDFLCPFCAMFEETNAEMLEELRTTGEATLVYHPVAYLDRLSNGTQYSTRSAQAAAVVADAAPEQFVDFWTTLFANQPAENSPGLDDGEIARLALGVGVPQDVVDTFGDGRFTEWVTAASEQATRDLPRPATPTVLIDGTAFEGDWRDPELLRSAILEAG
jgi:protein-disulfide isomerase